MSVPSVNSSSIMTESDTFEPSYGTLSADFFDDYLKQHPPTVVEHDYSVLSDPDFFRSVSGNSGSADTSASSLDDDMKHPIPSIEVDDEVWTQDLTDLQGYSIYLESSERAAMSEAEIRKLEGITLESPHTPAPFQPSFSQSPYDTATFLRRPTGITDTPSRSSRNASGCVTRSQRNPIRKANSFPKMTHGSHRSSSDLWATTFDSPNHGLSLHGQASSMCSISSGFSTPEKSRGHKDVSYVNSMDQSFSSDFFDFETPLSTPVSNVQSVRRTRSEQQVSDNAIFPDFDYISNGWSSIPNPSALHTDDNSLPCSSAVDSPIWWNHATTAPMAQPSPTSLHVNPRRATGSLAVQLQNTLSHTANALPYRPSNMTSSRLIHKTEISSETFALDSPMAQCYNPAPSPSQYLSNPTIHACDPSPRRPRLVRKPRFGPGELDPPSPSPSPELQIRKRKTSRLCRQPTSSRSPSLGASVGFVNYTPDDSQKILTGVAPSGSSKTKARREKEALEKRRKLSQAAVRAVRAAGGDVNALVEEGLLV